MLMLKLSLSLKKIKNVEDKPRFHRTG